MRPSTEDFLANAPKLDLAGRDINRCSLADPVVIPRIIWSETNQPPSPLWGPGWARVSEYSTGKHLKPHIRCICGQWTGIGLHHVHADGRVTASFFDATKQQLAGMGPQWANHPGGCGWHVFIKLDGYDWGEFPPEPHR